VLLDLGRKTSNLLTGGRKGGKGTTVGSGGYFSVLLGVSPRNGGKSQGGGGNVGDQN